MINNLIPKDVTKTIKQWAKKTNKTSQIIHESITNITYALKSTWILRCKDTTEWENKNNITRNKKRDKTFYTSANTDTPKTKNRSYMMYSKLNFISFIPYVYNKLAIDNVDTRLV
jgi:hypothetical protein